MSKTIREHISSIHVVDINLDYIAQTGQINGSLLLSIEKIMRDYSQSQTQELQQQNEKLVEMLEYIFYKTNFQNHFPTTSIKVKNLLTKHNNLNKK